jgi:cAMP-specific phosphodiesterase 4/calcium/calmodulin-dependent 3',5'-cyclic nucleotide phosphodiesterase
MQIGFFEIVALPLYRSWAHAFPDATPLLHAVEDNCNR